MSCHWTPRFSAFRNWYLHALRTASRDDFPAGWLRTEQRDWSPAPRNRYQAAFSLVFRVAVDNEKLTVNPAARIKRKAEHNDRIRFLSDKEETKLVTVIRQFWPHYLPTFLVSIHTGMRASEQFGLEWSAVSLARKNITLHRSKGGKTRHISLNAMAVAAFKELLPASPI